MKALQLVEWQKDPEIREVPVPEPGVGEILVKVGGAGACHSDLHVMEFPEGTMPYTLPFTLGHENAGWIEKLGPGVEGYSEGDPVAVYGPWGCGQCYFCRQGVEIYCKHLYTEKINGGACGPGLGLNGGMAPYMLVKSSRFLVPLETIAPKEAAPLTDAALTPYHAIKMTLDVLLPHTTAVVIGVGGLGQMAVQILRAMTSARIIAVDVSEDKLKRVSKMGADITFISDSDTPAKIADLTEGLGAEVVLDMVGVDPTMNLASQIAKRTGYLVIVGAGGGTLPVSFFTIPNECKVVVPMWGSLPDLVEVLSLAERGKIKGNNTYHPLEDAPKVYEAMRKGELAGRAVILPNG